MSFREIALRNAARGFRVHPNRPKDKLPILSGWPDQATTDTLTIERWAREYPDANCGLAVGADLCVLESDDLEKLKELLGPVEIPATYTVQARQNRPHFYFRQTAKTHQSGNRTLGGVFEFKQNRLQVVGEGSTHPCGAVYRVTQDVPVVAMPDELLTALVALQAKGQQGKEATPVEGNRNNYLTSVGGKLRNAGLSREALELALIQHNEDVCTPPLDDEEVKRIAASVARYDVPEPEPEVYIDSKPTEDPGRKDWREHYHTFEEMRDAPPAAFLIDGFLLQDAITALAAPVAQRKSLIALNVAHALCTGQPLFDYFEVSKQPTRVLYLCPEMGIRSFTERLRKIGLVDRIGETLFCRTMSAEGTLALSELTTEELKDAVVIIDTAVRYLKGDENSSEHMRAFAEDIFRLMKDGAVSVLLLHHSAKGTKESAELSLENAMRGSGELGAFVASCWATRLQDPAEPYQSASYLKNVKQRDFESKPFEVTSGPDCRLHIVDKPGDHVTLSGKSISDRDGNETEAVQIIKDNPKLSLSKLVAKMAERGIKRSKSWVGNKRADVLHVGVKTSA